jgi:hypothetical protein
VLDLPGIVEGASSGRGRGRQVVAVAKVSSVTLKTQRNKVSKTQIYQDCRFDLDVPGCHQVGCRRRLYMLTSTDTVSLVSRSDEQVSRVVTL